MRNVTFSLFVRLGRQRVNVSTLFLFFFFLFFKMCRPHCDLIREKLIMVSKLWVNFKNPCFELLSRVWKKTLILLCDRDLFFLRYFSIFRKIISIIERFEIREMFISQIWCGVEAMICNCSDSFAPCKSSWIETNPRKLGM